MFQFNQSEKEAKFCFAWNADELDFNQAKSEDSSREDGCSLCETKPEVITS